MMKSFYCCAGHCRTTAQTARLAAALGAMAVVLGCPMPGHAARHTHDVPVPVATIPVTPLGFHAPGEIYLTQRLSSTSLDFVDDSHLLFTFHESRLMQRELEPGHDDQNIRAVLLDVATGKVEKTAQWRMHDRFRYLLPGASGAVMVRQGNSIRRADQDLELRPFLNFDERLFEMDMSPDRKLLIAQLDLERHSAESHKRLVERAVQSGESLPDEDVQLQMIRLSDRSVVAVAKAENPVRLAVSSSGYVMHEQRKAGAGVQDGDAWQISFIPFEGNRKPVMTLHSLCAPTEQFLNETTLLLTSCTGHTADRTGHAVSLEGKELWTGSWDARLVWPNYYLAAGGTAFAIEFLRISHPVDSFDPVNDSDVEGQVVQVLSTATGHLLLTVPASPVFSGGQNFALSADGKRFAVLNQGAIQVFAVPAEGEGR